MVIGTSGSFLPEPGPLVIIRTGKPLGLSLVPTPAPFVAFGFAAVAGLSDGKILSSAASGSSSVFFSGADLSV